MENTEGYRLTKERFEEICRGEGMEPAVIATLWPPPSFVEWALTNPIIEEAVREQARWAVREMPGLFGCRKSS